MKKIVVLILMMAFILCLYGCNDAVEEKDGFLSTDQTVSGGETIDELNLTQISVKNGEYVEIVLSFAQGSDLAGKQQSTLSKVPEYYVSFCENPTRLVLGVKNLKYWDYQQNITANDDTGLIQGFFKVLPAGSRTYSQIYVNLSASVVFRVFEEEGSIRILLKKEETTQSKKSYYVYGNLTSEYYDGALDEEAGFTPTLTNDFSAVVMISRAFDSNEEAENFKTETENQYSYLLATKKLNIFSSDESANGLPPYLDSGVTGELNNNVLVSKDGISKGLNVFLADARPLNISHDGKKAIFGRKEINGEYETEVLFVVREDGTMTKLTEYETTSVVMSMFSPDDKFFFYVEQIDGAMLASIYDFDSGKLKSIDEEAIGTFIAGAAWSDDSKQIYFLSSEDIISLKRYDVQSGKVTVINDQNLIESELYFANDKLYYYSVDDEGAIVSVDTTGNKQETLAVGEYFSMDRQGNSLIIKKPTNSQEGADTLTIYTLNNKNEKTIIENVILGQYFFSLDGTKVFYTVVNHENDGFPQTLYCYDVNSGNSIEVFKSKKSELHISFKADELMMQITYDKDGVVYPVTYKVSIN